MKDEYEIDKDDASRYLISSHQGTKLIVLQFVSIPKNSPAFDGVLNAVTGHFGEIDLNVNRVCIARVLHWVNKLLQTLNDVIPTASNNNSNNVIEHVLLFFNVPTLM